MKLRIAVQSKGRLNEDTMSLLAEAGIKVSSSKRTLLVSAKKFPMEVLYLRDDDIPETVTDGVNGYLIPTYDTDAMARRINTLIENDETRLSFSKNSLNPLSAATTSCFSSSIS